MIWGAVLSALIGAAGTYMASKQAGKAAAMGKSEQDIQRLLAEALKTTGPMGLQYLREGKDLMGQAVNRNNRLANGSRSDAMQLLAPQLNASGEAAQSAEMAANALAPRSGATADARLGLIGNLVNNNANMLMQARSGAADQQRQDATNMSATGSALLGQNGMTGLGLMGQLAGNRQSAYNMGIQAGEGWAGFLQNLQGVDWSKLFAQRNTQAQQLPVQQRGTNNYGLSYLAPGQETLPTKTYTPPSGFGALKPAGRP